MKRSLKKIAGLGVGGGAIIESAMPTDTSALEKTRKFCPKKHNTSTCRSMTRV